MSGKHAWRDLAIEPAADIATAVRAIDRGEAGIALVVDEKGRLLGTVTDGDVRRGLLRGVGLDRSVREVLHSSPTVAPVGADRQALMALMRTRSVRQVPVVDEHMVVRDLVLLSDLVPEAQERSNYTLIMVGGEGRRLAPLTDATPKPLLPVGDRPLLDTTLERLAEQGFRNVILAVRFLGDRIREHCGDGSRWGLSITYVAEESMLGTAGAIGLARAQLREPFLVMNGDLLTNVDFGLLLTYHVDSGADATVGVREYGVEVPYGAVRVLDDRVVKVEEKPIIRLFINAGVYVLDPKLIDLLKPGERTDMPDLINSIVGSGAIVASFPIREYWLDIGRPRDYAQAGVDYEANFGKERGSQP